MKRDPTTFELNEQVLERLGWKFHTMPIDEGQVWYGVKPDGTYHNISSSPCYTEQGQTLRLTKPRIPDLMDWNALESIEIETLYVMAYNNKADLLATMPAYARDYTLAMKLPLAYRSALSDYWVQRMDYYRGLGPGFCESAERYAYLLCREWLDSPLSRGG